MLSVFPVTPSLSDLLPILLDTENPEPILGLHHLPARSWFSTSSSGPFHVLLSFFPIRSSYSIFASRSADPSHIQALVSWAVARSPFDEVGFAGLETRLVPLLHVPQAAEVRAMTFDVFRVQDKAKLNAYLATLDTLVEAPFVVGELHPQDAEEVNNRWEYRSRGTCEYIRESIALRPSVCVRNPSKDNEMVCYAITHDMLAVGILHTIHEYRGKGMGKLVSALMVRKLLAEFAKISESLPGLPVEPGPYATISRTNTPSRKIFEAMGFGYDPDQTMSWCTVKRRTE